MAPTSRLNVTAGVAVGSAILLAVTPVAPVWHGLQDRAVALTSAAVGTVANPVDQLDPGIAALANSAAHAPALGSAPVIPPEPVIPPGTDPFDFVTVAQAIIEFGQAQVAGGFADMGQGDLADGLSAVFSGVDNILFTAPVNVLLGLIESAGGQLPAYYFFFGGAGDTVPTATDFSSYISGIQFISDHAQDALSDGLSALSGGAMNLGLGKVADFLGDAFIVLPEYVVLVGPLEVLLASF